MSNHSYQSSTFQLSRSNAWLLWLSQLLNISSLATELSTWMLGILALCFCWQALLLSRQKSSRQKILALDVVTDKVTDKPSFSVKQVSPYLLMFFAISGCVAIAVSAKQLGMLSAMIHLLSFAYALKAFELKERKDFYQHILLSFFLLASALIFKQDLAFSLLILLLLLFNITVLHGVFVKRNSFYKSSKTVVVLALQSSFLAVILFVIFPRLAPFWQVPQATSAKTGLSDEVSPGDIANLALSNELAFRVTFKNEKIPAYSRLYWRAMTLENYDGRKWTRAKPEKKLQKQQTLHNVDFSPLVSGAKITYQIIAEPSYQSWLFALSVATKTDSHLLLQKDYTVQSTTVVNQPKYYQIQSFLNAPLALSITDESRQRNLMIKQGSNPRLEQLALKLKTKYADPLTLAQAILTTFREQNYYYTLQAPLLINNSLDQFYFNTKAGFCVHYASSFTYLIRATGIPARVVTGYLGGEYNSLSSENNSTTGGHLSIYQYDAHAWSEIWLEGIGWYRIDPTAAVDPERVTKGLSTNLLEQQSTLNNAFISLYQFKQLAWLNALRLKLDAIDYQWTRWVLGYSAKQQYELLKQLFGQGMYWKAAALITVVFVLTMGIFALFYHLKSNKNKNKRLPAQKLYYECLSALEKKGIIKEPHLSVQQFYLLVEQKLPDLSSSFKAVTNAFELLHYQQHNKQDDHALLVQLTDKKNCFLSALKKVSIHKDDTKRRNK